MSKSTKRKQLALHTLTFVMLAVATISVLDPTLLVGVELERKIFVELGIFGVQLLSLGVCLILGLVQAILFFANRNKDEKTKKTALGAIYFQLLVVSAVIFLGMLEIALFFWQTMLISDSKLAGATIWLAFALLIVGAVLIVIAAFVMPLVGIYKTSKGNDDWNYPIVKGWVESKEAEQI